MYSCGMYWLVTSTDLVLGLRGLFVCGTQCFGFRCIGALGGLEPNKVSAKGSSGGGVKNRPLSAQHSIAEITD